MPTRKVISIFIVCLAIIAGIGIFQHNAARTQALLSLSNSIGVSVDNTTRPNIATSTDWQALLQNSWGSGSTTAVGGMYGTTGPTPISDGEGTLTDQMAKDFFGQYLQLSQGGQTVTADQATQIANNTLSEPQYTQATGVQYAVTDLHNVLGQTNKTMVAQYQTALNDSFTKNLSKITTKDDVTTIVNNAVQSKKDSDLTPLDPMIAGEKAEIADLLVMPVPSTAVTLHVALLNAMSNVLANTEAMRVVLTDPVRSFAAVSQYKQHTLDVGGALDALQTYFTANQ